MIKAVPRKKIGFCLIGFLLLLFLAGFLCVKIDRLLTPEVSWTVPKSSLLITTLRVSGQIVAGEGIFSLSLAQDAIFSENAVLSVSTEDHPDPIPAMFLTREYKPESGKVLGRCQLGETSSTFYDGQPCIVRLELVLGSFSTIVPAECVYEENDDAYLYLLEERQTLFTKLVARRVPVEVEASNGIETAVKANLTTESRVIQYASEPITNEQKLRLAE